MSVMRTSRSERWIARSGQEWKFYVTYVLALVAFVFIWAFVRALDGGTDIATIVSACGFVVFAGAAFAWLLWSIRCPLCGNRPVGRIIKNAPAGQWFIVLYGLPRCPSCQAPD